MSERPLRILALEDEPADAELLRRCLERIPSLRFEFQHCVRAEEALNVLRFDDVDVFFLDYRLDPECGLDVLHNVRESGNMRPIIVLTGHGNEYIAAKLTRAGADDYLCKNDLAPEPLRRAIENALAQYDRRKAERDARHRHEMIESLSRRLAEANIQLARLTRIDPLTELFNRTAWEESITLEHQRALRNEQTYAIVMIDVDYFKAYNDNNGHQAGDACLKRVALCIAGSCRSIDIAGRYGGEEFIVLAPETNLDGGLMLAERILRGVRGLAIPHPYGGPSGIVSASLGVAVGPGHSWEYVVSCADEALYEAKRLGRDRVHVYRDDALKSRPEIVPVG
jgi:diguanylate cyclase (GGDEF)-like protein